MNSSSPGDPPAIDPARAAELDLVERIRQGRSDAWQQFIDRYEGRLLAYVDSRIRNRATAEDIVQEALVGFLVSLPNYDGQRPLEAYLFSICAYKLTDHLRHSGRRPAMQMLSGQRSRDENWDPQGRGRMASSIARSSERKKLEAMAISQSISEQIQRWKAEENWPKLKAIEMIYVRGTANKEIAKETGLTEQQVANLKSDFQIRLRSIISRMGLDQGVFPELSPPG